MKKILVSTAIGTMLIVGGVAVAQSNAPAAGQFVRGPMHADVNKDGKLTKAEATAAAEQMFAKMDANGDGKVTKEEREALHQKRFDERFAKMDTDGNGQISKAEFQARRDARQAKVAEWRSGDSGPAGRGPSRRGGQMRGGMWGVDADKDGTITRAEFMARPIAMFDRADANKDGTVTPEELKAAHPARGGHGKGRHVPPQPQNQ
ncbi:MAG: EF-hand domain-containing protein [Sphingobium sp.]|uniref:EF-hand domain-containing protein n=1 Tax=Sphingobium sp. TaxID=1912891 RepID=UPI0029AE34BD|nr:EF-hand domain-containing protein [Sphingobium sp.]MDX3909308.1 EF-hand domain-containing protein [Sphingobium sp.]